MINKDYKMCPVTKFVVWLILGLIVCFVGISNTKALSITDYSTKYYYCVTSSSGDQCGSTNYRSGSSNQLTMDGTSNYPPTYDKFDIFTGMYNQINMQVTAGSTYTFTIEVVYSNLSETEFNVNNLSRFNQFKGTNNGIVNNVSYTYTRRSIQDALPGYYEYRIFITYTLTPSSNANTIYLGSYTTSGYTFGFNEHQYRTLVYVASINVDVNNDSTIINQNETIINQNQEIINNIDNINDTINDDDVDSSSWSNFFNNFTTNTFGLTSIITAPLNLIQSLTNTSCTELQLPLPYLQNKYLTLPCMTTIYSQYFGNFFTLYQTITYGIIAYWVCVRIFNLVKDFKNPDHDEIEVVDL